MCDIDGGALHTYTSGYDYSRAMKLVSTGVYKNAAKLVFFISNIS